MKKLILSGLILTAICTCAVPEQIDDYDRDQIEKPVARKARSTVQEVSDQNQYNQIIADNEYVIVDCFATWCGPCQKMLPVFSDAASNYSQITFIKVDIQKSSIASNLGVRSIPTFLFYKNGALQFRKTGSMNKDKFAAEIQKLIS